MKLSHPKNLSDADYKRVQILLMNNAGINLHEGKRELVQARIGKRVRDLGLNSYTAYLDKVEKDPSGDERTRMVDILTTNVTHFFREAKHFEFLSRSIYEPARKSRQRDLRIWCAGCSTGEEAYSLAISLLETWPEASFSGALILATDISHRVLAQAKMGTYPLDRLKETSPHILAKYFSKENGPTPTYTISKGPRDLVRFRHLNLMDPWPMTGQFDAIFCRNVMIYFNEQTQLELILRFHKVLKPGGFLLVGHSESLTRLQHPFKHFQPSVYQKV